MILLRGAPLVGFAYVLDIDILDTPYLRADRIVAFAYLLITFQIVLLAH